MSKIRNSITWKEVSERMANFMINFEGGDHGRHACRWRARLALHWKRSANGLRARLTWNFTRFWGRS
ncbi:hypothetical protein SAMN04489712_14319 [Thermomonospora echinospora]|uniref:Uncharacterized protein n=1 Tax=Thermomonospora echinospora TaxID=1992 RepID=A0A1H6EB23_9ACTN|nr:hypothetical protein SAMN04489712_14319 [Thermomonospora echinospora]